MQHGLCGSFLLFVVWFHLIICGVYLFAVMAVCNHCLGNFCILESLSMKYEINLPNILVRILNTTFTLK